ncbi:putative DNA-binding transcriptional regulator YafY [Actinocorallia herbida]|uniref:Putative DNA-binding transcriptional regulator YafY n=1 Tax=Actinocorallia herbida TaxID=58109 RepID=A0A3N1CXR1_9ACTN|nr:WYL domain-containing protein [Actinocorallia herbida]ROO85508.1 putative DNA-binding transcriptional regulator YafY [Actinocorallia herbida]
MLETSARLLALLSLFQSRPDWTGRELAERLGVSTRTVRNDIERLRDLGYPVDATRGAAGSYRLGAGTKLPPLLLDDQEAVAVAIGLRAATGVAGIAESGARALAKLEQVLPHRLRRQVVALHEATSRAPENLDTDAADPETDAAVLTAIAAAIRDRVEMRFDYSVAATEPGDGEPPSATAAPSGRRLAEPYRLVSWRRRWYLVARDPASGAWSSYRADWMTPLLPGRAFAPTPLPGGDYTSFVLRDVAATGWKVHARVIVLAPAEQVLARINATVGVVESVDADRCVLATGADTLETVAAYLGMLGLDFEVAAPPELADHVAALGRRYLRAAEGPSLTERSSGEG